LVFALFRASTVTFRNHSPFPARLARRLARRQAAEYAIDPSHTYASFEIDHLGFSTQRGQFNAHQRQHRFRPRARKRAHRHPHRRRLARYRLCPARRRPARRSDWFNTKAFPTSCFRSQKLVFDRRRLAPSTARWSCSAKSGRCAWRSARFKCGLNLANRKRGCGADAQACCAAPTSACRTALPFIGDEVRLRIQVEAYLP
jgi:polyisoprenoid-binding protein YceI